MGRKTERVTELYPDRMQIPLSLEGLTDRELVILAAGHLDIALVEMIAHRFLDIPRECEEFLGLNGDGRAPAGSFGARIQLALLLGLISEDVAKALRAIKSLRNLFAHRIIMDLLHADAQKPLLRLHEAYRGIEAEVNNEQKAAGRIYNSMGREMKTDPKAAARLVKLAYSYLTYNFHAWIMGEGVRIERLTDAIGR